jgi:hypothetical protein
MNNLQNRYRQFKEWKQHHQPVAHLCDDSFAAMLQSDSGNGFRCLHPAAGHHPHQAIVRLQLLGHRLAHRRSHHPIPHSPHFDIPRIDSGRNDIYN